MLSFYIIVGLLMIFSSDPANRFTGCIMALSVFVGTLFGFKYGVIFFFAVAAILLILVFLLPPKKENQNNAEHKDSPISSKLEVANAPVDTTHEKREHNVEIIDTWPGPGEDEDLPF